MVCLFSDDGGVRVSACKALSCGSLFKEVDFVDRELVLVGVGGKEIWLGLDEKASCDGFCSAKPLEFENVEDVLLDFRVLSHIEEEPGADPVGVSVGDVGCERYAIAIIEVVAFFCCLLFFAG